MICQHCGQRPATRVWVGKGGLLAYVHGAVANWCERCVVAAQLDYARERAAAVPELIRRLAELDTICKLAEDKGAGR